MMLRLLLAWTVVGTVSTILAIAALLVWWRFDRDMEEASARVSHGSTVVDTRCGPIEYQQAGSGIPLLAIRGSGGGFDQGMAFGGALVEEGVRLIAMPRFGYLRTAGSPRRGLQLLLECGVEQTNGRAPMDALRQSRHARNLLPIISSARRSLADSLA